MDTLVMTRMSKNIPVFNRKLIKYPLTTIWIGLLSCILSFNSYATSNIVMVLSSNALMYKQVYQTFHSTITTSNISNSVNITKIILNSEANNLQVTPALASNDLIIAVGSKASQYIEALHTLTPTLSVLITQNTWHKIWMHGDYSQHSTAIYLDQPYQRLVNLCSLLPIPINSLGAIFSPSSLDKFKIMEHVSYAKGLDLNAAILNKNDNPIHILEPILKNSDVFLALPDAAIFNKITAKWILILGIKYQIPIIGFSKAYTDAGALAALHSTPEDTGTDATNWVKQWVENQHLLPRPRFNKIFTLSTNPQVARSLKIPELDAISLKQQLTKLDQAH